MNDTVPPSLSSLGRGRSGEDLDRLLRAFYQRQMPDPFPKLPDLAGMERDQVLPLRAQSKRSRKAIWRSRMALAASIALFFVGQSLLFDGSNHRGPKDGPAAEQLRPIDHDNGSASPAGDDPRFRMRERGTDIINKKIVAEPNKEPFYQFEALKTQLPPMLKDKKENK